MSIVGIDLGTTNSLIGRIEKGRPRLFEAENGSSLVPSVVRFENGEVVVGIKAKEALNEALARTIFSAKRFIGRGINDVTEWRDALPFDFSPSDDQMVRFQVGDKKVTPIEVAAHVLRKLKTMAEAQSGEKVEKAVVTVPAYFNDAQRQATKFAGELAGLEVVRIVNEPTAACLAYGLDKKTKGKIAVFDLGGGTFDISILRVADGIFEVLATNGDTALGGDDFDHAIARGINDAIRKSSRYDAWSDEKARALLVSKAEVLKRELSEAQSAEFSFEPANYRTTFSRSDLESWIEPVIARVEKPCLSCLKDSGLSPADITDVILVGGSTRVPAVRKKVAELFKRQPICTLNPDEVVAMGAAVQANILAGKMAGMLLLDVIPLSLGIETMGGVVSKIIHRNATIPVSAAQSFTTYVDGQVAVDIHVVQGEREMVKDNRSLARFQLRGLPPLPAGVPKIEVEFIVDANGILNVRAMELRTGKSAEVLVNPSYGLNDTEVERMLMDSYENAEADFSQRFVTEARTEADSLIRSVQKSLAKGEHLITGDEKASILVSVQNLESSLSATDHKIIRAKIDELGHATQHLAEALLNHAVKEALRDKNLGE